MRSRFRNQHVMEPSGSYPIDRIRIAAVIIVALLPPAAGAAILWVVPVEGLTADRTAVAARDFTALWMAGRLALTHALDVLTNPALYSAALRSRFGAGFPDQIWPYPPPFLLLAALLSKLPLVAGFLLYTAATPTALWIALRLGGFGAAACAAVLLSPAVADNALTGQNGALTAALLTGGLLLVDRRPVIAGLLLGALVIKPQLGLLVPICLLASGCWRILFAAGASSVALAGASGLLFGMEAWTDFWFRSRPLASAYLESPWRGLPSQQIFASVFMAARSLGGSLGVAYGAQAAVTLGCGLLAWRAWRMRGLDPLLRMALTAALSVAAAPWIHAYDMPCLAACVVVLLPRTRPVFRPFLVFAWFWPGAVVILPIPLILSVASVASVVWLAWRQVSGQAASVR